VFALIGNFLVVWVTIRTSQLHSPSNILIGLVCLTLSFAKLLFPHQVVCFKLINPDPPRQLCFVDLLYALLHGVWVAAASLLKYWPWPGGGDGVLCKASGYTSVMWTGMLFMMLAVISLDKLIATVYPLKYRKIMTRRSAMLMWLGAVITPIILIVTPLGILDMKGQLNHTFYSDYGQCILFFYVDNTAFVEVHDYPLILLPWSLWMLTQLVPLVIIILCYSKIFYEVRRQVAHTRRHSIMGRGILRSYKAVTTIFLIIVTFVVTWLPEFVLDIMVMLHIINTAELSETTFSVLLVTRWLYYLSPTLDPYIYALRHQRLQSAIKQTFCIEKYRGDFVNSVSDTAYKAFKRMSTAVNSERLQLQRQSSRIIGSMTGSVGSLGSLISFHTGTTPKTARRSVLATAQDENGSLSGLRTEQGQNHGSGSIKSWQRKVSMVPERAETLASPTKTATDPLVGGTSSEEYTSPSFSR